MPSKIYTDDWVKSARRMIRSEMAADAKWYISNRRGSVQLEVRDNGQYQSIMLNYEWSKNDLFKAARRIIVIYKNFYSEIGQQSLAKSCDVTEAISSKGNIDYDQLIKDFRAYCPTASDATFKKCYVPVLNHAKKLLTSKADKADKADFSTNASMADKAKEVLNGSVPKYGIIMWTQRSIPDGWRLCDGGGSTPNLINRFVVGAGNWYKLGNTGGANNVTLSWNQLPKHSHSGGTYGGGNHYHGIYTRQDDWNDSGGWGPSWGDGDNGRWAPHHTTHWGGHHSHSIWTRNSGRSHSVENRPPYYAVYYIMRVK